MRKPRGLLVSWDLAVRPPSTLSISAFESMSRGSARTGFETTETLRHRAGRRGARDEHAERKGATSESAFAFRVLVVSAAAAARRRRRVGRVRRALRPP